MTARNENEEKEPNELGPIAVSLASSPSIKEKAE